jgi:hypothetical protein
MAKKNNHQQPTINQISHEVSFTPKQLPVQRQALQTLQWNSHGLPLIQHGHRNFDSIL